MHTRKICAMNSDGRQDGDEKVIAAKFFEQAKQKINLLLPKITTGDESGSSSKILRQNTKRKSCRSQNLNNRSC